MLRRVQPAWQRNVNVSVPVLVLGLGDHGSLGIARSLGRLGVAVHGAHDGKTPAAASRWFRGVHSWDGSLDGALAIGARIGGRPLLLPTGDVTAMWVDDAAPALAARFDFPSPPTGLARQLSSKRGLHDLCVEHGIPTPATAFPNARGDVASYAGPFPIMVKAIDNASVERRAVRRMGIARDTSEALALYDELEDPDTPNLVMQELIPGGTDHAWMFDGYFDGSSSCLFGSTGRKRRQCPPTAGSTSLGECIANAEVADLAKRLVGAVGYQGIVDCDYQYDIRDGQYKLLDFNTRIGATFRLFVGTTGMDVVRAMYLDMTGQPVGSDAPQEHRRWVVESNDLVSFIVSRRAGELGTVDWVRSFRRVREGAWWAWDDPIPFVRIVGDTARRAGRRTRTLVSPRRRA